MSAVKKSHVLRIGRSGRFAMSVVDNLIFVHHQASKVSSHFHNACFLVFSLVFVLLSMSMAIIISDLT